MKLKRGIRLVLFSFLLIFVLFYLDRMLLMKRTDGIVTMQSFYAQEEDSIDLLVLGSSHVGMNLATETLWEEEGIAAYVLWGSMQPFWNTYYFLKEALKTQTPRVIVLDVYASTFDFEYSDEARQVTNIVGMKFSLNKLKAIKESAPSSRWMDLILGFPLYHSRYHELTKDDFSHFPWTKTQKDYKGTGFRYGVGEVTLEDAEQVTEIAMLHEKENQYLLKIIELCKEKQLPLVLIKTPTANRVEEQPYYHAVQGIAEEYGLPFYNMNLLDDQTGLTETDYWTDGQHLNTAGAQKISRWLGKLLKEEYQLENHRGEKAYQSWDQNAENVKMGYEEEKTTFLE